MREARAVREASPTREAILVAAERLFGERGFALTRLEDVASAVGIRRASLLYHFRDKRTLYQAVVADLLGGLLDRLESALARPETHVARVEAAVGAWVDYVDERPAIARIVLRELADAKRSRYPAVVQHASAVLQLADRVVREGQRLGVFGPIDPMDLASSVAGATVFLLVGAPLLRPPVAGSPRSRQRRSECQTEVLRLTRRLLGVRRVHPRTEESDA